MDTKDKIKRGKVGEITEGNKTPEGYVWSRENMMPLGSQPLGPLPSTSFQVDFYYIHFTAANWRLREVKLLGRIRTTSLFDYRDQAGNNCVTLPLIIFTICFLANPIQIT